MSKRCCIHDIMLLPASKQGKFTGPRRAHPVEPAMVKPAPLSCGAAAMSAGLMHNKGRVLAFDRDAERCRRLVNNMQAAGASCVKAEHADFLSLDPADARFASTGVQAALVTPLLQAGMAN